MTITIVPICHDCNEELSNWDRFLNKKYPNTLGWYSLDYLSSPVSVLVSIVQMKL